MTTTYPTLYSTADYFTILAASFLTLTSRQCDEAKPICGGCGRHQVTCLYDHPAKVKGEDSETSSSATSSTKTKLVESSSTAETTQRRLLERKCHVIT